MAGSNRKNLARQIGHPIPVEAKMTLHATSVAQLVNSRCFTCREPIKPGERVRWCEVAGIVPPGLIHAQHFDAGPMIENGRSPTRKGKPKRRFGPCIRHHWSEWRRAGIFDSTEVRTCRFCPATRTRPRQSLSSGDNVSKPANSATDRLGMLGTPTDE